VPDQKSISHRDPGTVVAHRGDVTSNDRRERMGDDDRARLREAILRYAREHPRASDTADGILGWWLPETGFEWAHGAIEPVLQALVDEGALQRIPLPDGSVLYAVSRPRQDEAGDEP
jgi:hypothetical protein